MEVNRWMDLLHFYHFRGLKFEYSSFDDEFISALYIQGWKWLFIFFFLLMNIHIHRHGFTNVTLEIVFFGHYPNTLFLYTTNYNTTCVFIWFFFSPFVLFVTIYFTYKLSVSSIGICNGSLLYWLEPRPVEM